MPDTDDRCIDLTLPGRGFGAARLGVYCVLLRDAEWQDAALIADAQLIIDLLEDALESPI